MPHRILTLFSKPLLLGAGAVWGWLEIAFLPKPMLIFFLVGGMMVDLLTGLLKSWSTGRATTSTGLRRTVIKISVYFSVIASTWILANLLSTMYKGPDYTGMVNWIIGLLSFIELYSVFENVYEMAPNSTLAKYVAKPFLKLLGGLMDRAVQRIKTYDTEKSADQPQDSGRAGGNNDAGADSSRV